MSIKEKKYLKIDLNTVVALRKALQAFEEQAEKEMPTVPKRRNTMKEQFDMNYMTGTWRKPEHLKKIRN